jgi:hypothetical protein
MSLALLRALALKLIPGLPHSTKVSVLQQTASDESATTKFLKSTAEDGQVERSENVLHKSALEHVVGSDMTRNKVLRELSSQ